MKRPDIGMIKEIAEHLDMGMLCFYHKLTGEIESYPDPLKHPEYDEGSFMDSRGAFRLMERFIREMVPLKLQDRFCAALSREKPFRRFNELTA